MRNLTDEEAKIYDDWLNAEAENAAEYTIDDICNELAQLIGIPCIFESAEEIMLHRCNDCGDGIPDSECWKRYFDMKFSDAGED